MTQLEQSEPASGKVQRQRVGVLVLGMHRSGTSLLSRLLSLYGCDLPSNLLPANEANSEGYWESAAVVAFNDALLTSGGSKWHDWLGFNPGWYGSPKKDEYLYRARDILKAEFGGSGLFVLKDPRICRLVPFWLEVLEQEGIEPAIVLPIRHPAMVARSLAMRDSIAPAIGQLLWLRHVLEAEAATRGRRRTILTFTQLLEDWPTLPERMSSALGVQWPRIGQVSRAEQAGFINPAMAHSEAALQNHPQSQNLSAGVVQTWAILADWAETGEKTSDHAALDVLREQLDRAGEITGEAIISSMNAHWLSLEKEQQVDALNGQLTQLTTQLDSQRAEHERLHHFLEQAREDDRADSEALRQTLRQEEDQLAQARARIAEARDKAAAMEADVRQLTEQLDETSASHEDERRHMADEMQLAHLAITEKEQALMAAHARIEESEQKLALMEGQVSLLATEMDATRAAIAQKEEALRLAQAQLEQADEKSVSLESEISALSANLEKAQAAITDKDHVLNAARSQFEEKAAIFATQLEEAQAVAKIADEEKRQLRQNVDALSEELVKTQASAQRVEADRNRLAERSDQLQAKLSVTQSNLQQRYAELDQLRHDLEQMQDAERRQSEQNALLQTEITGARERIAASEQYVVAIREELEATRTRLDAMIARNIRLEQDAASLRGQIDIVEAARDDANQRNRKLENAVDTLRMQDLRVARLTEEVQNARALADQARREARDYAQAAEYSSSHARQYEEEIARLRDDAAEAHARSLGMTDQVRMLASELEETRHRAEADHAAHARLNHDLVQQRDDHESALRDMRAQADILQRKIERQAQEHHLANQQLFDEKRFAQATFEQQQWLLAVNQAMIEPGRWWVQFLPPSYRERMVRRRLARRDLFDSDAYLARYDDVARSGMDPLQHYMRHGIYEGRIRN